GDARGLEVSPGGLLQNELVQRQIGNRLAEPAVLELKVLQALHLLALQPTKLLAPPIIRHLAHPDLADRVHHVLALRDQNIDLPQLRNDLFRLVSLSCHCSPPGCQRHTSSRTTSMGVDHRHRCNALVQSPPVLDQFGDEIDYSWRQRGVFELRISGSALRNGTTPCRTMMPRSIRKPRI